jgi:hypothetical protein
MISSKSKKISFEAISQDIFPTNAQLSKVACPQFWNNTVLISLGHQAVLEPEEQCQAHFMKKGDAISHEEIDDYMLSKSTVTMYSMSTIEANKVI